MPRSIKKLEERIDQAKNREQKAIAYYDLGLFHDNNARESEAIPKYEMALKLGLEKDLKSKALAWLASSLYKTGKPKEALGRIKLSQKIANENLRKFLDGLTMRIEKSMKAGK